MLVGNSKPEYVFTRLAIWGLRFVAPASIVYSAVVLLLQPGHGLLRTYGLIPLHAWMLGESAFFLGAYLPLRAYFQGPAQHPPPPSRAERQQLFERVKDNALEPELYLSKWFMNASISEIRRENLKEFFAWSLMNQRLETCTGEEVDELDGYVDELETTFERRFESGRGKAFPLRGSFDPVPMQHRPLLWYGIVLVVDVFSSCRLWTSFALYRQPGLKPLQMLPQRWHTLCATRISHSPNISYWFRKHTSKTRLPILFIHGIGIGIFAYVDFLNALVAESNSSLHGDDGQVGIIALELMSISSRICAPALDSPRMRHEIHKILNRHGWSDFVLAAHSYGTAIASNMMQHQLFESRIKAAVLMDPICFALHLPDVAYNFTRREPVRANERMLYYFASQDMLISHTLARHFFWSEYCLWKDDVLDLPLTVTLSGRDLIVPKEAVWKYLTGSEYSAASGNQDIQIEHVKEHDGDSTRVIWFDDFDHAGLFASKGACRGVARRVLEHSGRCSERELLP